MQRKFLEREDRKRLELKLVAADLTLELFLGPLGTIGSSSLLASVISCLLYIVNIMSIPECMENNDPNVLKVGMIGGSSGFISNAHQRAIFMDGTRRVVCGALSSNVMKSRAAIENWPYPIQGYNSYDELLEAELAKPDSDRIDYVLILTPNHVHFDPAKKFLEAEIPVLCEKPLTFTLDEAETLAEIVHSKGIPFCVAHTYLGHWTSRLARFIVQSGLIGEVRWVDASYLQSWMSIRSRDPEFVKKAWRMDASRSGLSNCGGDIGTHALMQLRYVTGLEVVSLSAYMESLTPLPEPVEQPLDDHFTVYCRMNNGSRALIRATQIGVGHKNDLRIEVNGELGSIRWAQEESEKLEVYLIDQPERTYYRGGIKPNDGFFGDIPKELLDEPTIPWGHSEGFHDAFARLHRCFEGDVRSFKKSQYEPGDGSKYATVGDGVVGMHFVKKAVESSRNGNAWVDC